MLSKLDKTIIGIVSQDIPLTKRPFGDLARRLGVEEDFLLKRMRLFKKNNIMRKFTAVLNHKKIGFCYNAMVVWDVPDRLVDKAGSVMASFNEVSHCYQRKRVPGWSYNLYSMVHGKTKEECLKTIERISKRIGPDIDHMALFSSKEEKKTGAKFQ